MAREAAWIASLRQHVAGKPMVVFRFTSEEWNGVRNSLRGQSRFTAARSHELFRDVDVPTLCLIFTEETFGGPLAFAGVFRGYQAATTLESRAVIESVHEIRPSSEAEIMRLMPTPSLRTFATKRLSEGHTVTRLSSGTSDEIVERLAAKVENQIGLKSIFTALGPPRRYSGNAALQEDAVNTALKIFGVATHLPAYMVDVQTGKKSALGQIRVLEDAIIERDAKKISSFDIVDADVTGRAVFAKDGERLVVITANKRPLEKVLGVDLIYLNADKQNVVMVQYKMLEPQRRQGRVIDWLYRPDDQLRKEVRRMRNFSRTGIAGKHEYRLNPQVFYLKFVHRDGLLGDSAITMPINHFEIMKRDPLCKGPRGSFRVSFQSLSGRYLRQTAFMDLVRSGYIGAHAEKTEELVQVIETSLRNDRAVVAAYQLPVGRVP